MEQLTNFDIEEIYHLFKIDLKACIDYHELLHFPFEDGSYILNLGNAHWTALFIKDGDGLYFDSYGVDPPVAVQKFCHELSVSDDTIQSLNSVLCGYYCLYFLYYMTNRFQHNIEHTWNLFRSQFDDDERKNDKILQYLIKRIL